MCMGGVSTVPVCMAYDASVWSACVCGTALTNGTTCHHSGHTPPSAGRHLADCTQGSSTPVGHHWSERRAGRAAPACDWREKVTGLHQHKLKRGLNSRIQERFIEGDNFVSYRIKIDNSQVMKTYNQGWSGWGELQSLRRMDDSGVRVCLCECAGGKRKSMCKM